MSPDLLSFRRTLAARLRALRLSRGLRQKDFEAFGVSWRSVQKLESGETDPQLSTLLKLCTAFGMSLSELLQAPDAPKDEGSARGPR